MAITVTTLTVLGTACPWKVGSLSSNTGSSGVLEPYNTPFYDGSVAGSGGSGQNTSYPYGKSHTHAGETGPTTLSITPGQMIFLEYISGTVATQGSGAGNSGPAGSATTGVTPYPAQGCDGATFPTDVIPGFGNFNATGTVNTSGTAVTWVSGTKFNGAMASPFSQLQANMPIWINAVKYFISTVNSTTSITLTATAGTQTGVTYIFAGAQTSIGGLVGAFTDASGNVISLFDWAGMSGINPVGALTLTSVAATTSGTATYSGTITNGGSSAFAGYFFTITGFTNACNNGTFFCTSSNTTQLFLQNIGAITETHAATAQQISGIGLRVPAGAAYLSLGDNDTVLHDNTGSFSVKAFQFDSVGGSYLASAGWVPPFKDWPISPTLEPDIGYDVTKMKNVAWMAPCSISLTKAGANFMKSLVGQLFPRGGQTVGKGAQIFPY